MFKIVAHLGEWREIFASTDSDAQMRLYSPSTATVRGWDGEYFVHELASSIPSPGARSRDILLIIKSTDPSYVLATLSVLRPVLLPIAKDLAAAEEPAQTELIKNLVAICRSYNDIIPNQSTDQIISLKKSNKPTLLLARFGPLVCLLLSVLLAGWMIRMTHDTRLSLAAVANASASGVEKSRSLDEVAARIENLKVVADAQERALGAVQGSTTTLSSTIRDLTTNLENRRLELQQSADRVDAFRDNEKKIGGKIDGLQTASVGLENALKMLKTNIDAFQESLSRVTPAVLVSESSGIVPATGGEFTVDLPLPVSDGTTFDVDVRTDARGPVPAGLKVSEVVLQGENTHRSLVENQPLIPGFFYRTTFDLQEMKVEVRAVQSVRIRVTGQRSGNRDDEGCWVTVRISPRGVRK